MTPRLATFYYIKVIANNKDKEIHIPMLDGLSLLPILNRFLNVKPSQSHFPETPKDDGSINKFDKTRLSYP